jgi:mannose-6-phosphate isomerase-like protein (cupin superfamily)
LNTIAQFDLPKSFESLTEPSQPRVVAEMNDYQIKILRIEGDFVWHCHPETDEAFIVLEGEPRIDFRDTAVTLKAGELLRAAQ